MILTWLSLAITLFLLALFPFVFSELMVASLAKLHLDPGTAASIVVAVMLGGLINIPIARIPLEEEILIHPLAVFGLSGVAAGNPACSPRNHNRCQCRGMFNSHGLGLV
jgi:uncharacterized membrane protein